MRFLSTLVASVLGTLIALGLIWFIFVLFILALIVSVDPSPQIQAGSVLVVNLEGDLPEVAADDPYLRILTGDAPRDLNRFRTNLRKAAVDDRIAALWLQLRATSSSWATLGEMREALLAFKESGKPIYASSESHYMHEADYFLASVADSIFASPEGLFEFNGFYITAEFYKPLLDRLNVEPQVVRAGDFKSAVEPFLRETLSPENREQLEHLLEDWNAVFIRSIAESRGMRESDLADLAGNASILSAADAKEARLLDDLLYHEQIVEAWKRRLGITDEDDLPLVEDGSYAHVTPERAGIRVGDEGEIAVVYASGTILGGQSRFEPNPLFGGTSVGSETFVEAMREARQSRRVKAIVARINSPGGVTPAGDEMWHAMRLAADTKPVVVSMGDYAASAGYWMATAGDVIVANPLSITGSIGVFSVFFDLGDLFEDKIGITFDQVRTTPQADMFSGLRPLTTVERNALQRSVDAVYATFLERVATSRGMSLAQVDSIGRGRVWTGIQAQRLGLVDELGSMTHAVRVAAERADLAEGTYRLRILPRPPGIFEQISERFYSYAASLATRMATTPAERVILDQVRHVTELLSANGTVQAKLPTRLHVK